ncbi:MAG: AAA family ATPase, partial [Odoribacter sp.]|nr:AAA family ATPase [Odoribacter sp.]
MQLQELNIINFKNIGEATLAFTSGFNCFVGKNGMGKTNILDAIYHLSMCKSYF